MKSCFALSSSPSPIVLATSALPPVPSIKPRDPIIMITGYIIFTAARAVLPIKFDTK